MEEFENKLKDSEIEPKRSGYYHAGVVMTFIAGAVGLVLSILNILEVVVYSWFLTGGYGMELSYWPFISVVCSALLIVVGFGSIFLRIPEIYIGVICIVLALALAGIPEIFALIAGVLFIIDGLA
ncbi:MAG: hypothetical protein FK734_00765 [Asgard group archaeon]|nr:hypothetical protein [Asgard group archaeon]